MLLIKKVADLLRWFSRPKPRLIQSRWAVNSYIINITSFQPLSIKKRSAQTADPIPLALTPIRDGQ